MKPIWFNHIYCFFANENEKKNHPYFIARAIVNCQLYWCTLWWCLSDLTQPSDCSSLLLSLKLARFYLKMHTEQRTKQIQAKIAMSIILTSKCYNIRQTIFRQMFQWSISPEFLLSNDLVITKRLFSSFFF